MGSDSIQTPIQFVKGVGPHVARLLGNMGITSVADLLYTFPIRYVDRRQISPIRALTSGKEKSIVGDVVGLGTRMLPRTRKKILEMVVSDGTGIALVVWFHFNEAYLKKLYPAGKKIFISGECQYFGAQKQFVHPEIESWEEDAGESVAPILPVYPLTEGMYQKTLRKIVWGAVETYLPHLEESPLTVRASGETKLSLKESLAYLHHPPATALLADLNEQKTPWHQRVIYDELFFLQLGMGIKKLGFKKDQAPALPGNRLAQAARQRLPFKLTMAQERVLSEIALDVAEPFPMNRLLQGDVGSGKTLVAFLAALSAIENGYQAVLMAPTEILAEQHFLTLSKLAFDLDVPVGLLMGSTPTAQRKQLHERLASGKPILMFGTHALIQEDVPFPKLGLVVVDEQHRFGVKQRAVLKNKSELKPHVLVMTATPIPRTMAMSAYGDLDLSVLDERPPGRIPIVTKIYTDKSRVQALQAVGRELMKGRQAYFVYPLIEESEKTDLKNAQDMALELTSLYKNHRVALLHGKMKSEEKEAIMAAFKKGEIHVLVSTTVIEVGVDVPNASVMVVEHAERFGLSQLHQLRGRVGRGAHESFCFLISGYAQSEESRARLKVMEETEDGFKISEEDLKIRGPGDFLGTRQSGLPDFRLAHLARDGHLLAAAKKRAEEILAIDPELKMGEHALLGKILKQRWEGKLELADVS